jgi:hypothetical protein
MNPDYAAALDWLNKEFPGICSLRVKDTMRCFQCKETTARELCKKHGVKAGDPCIPKPVAAKMIAAKMGI